MDEETEDSAKVIRAKCLHHIEGLNVLNDKCLVEMAENNFKLQELWKEICRLEKEIR